MRCKLELRSKLYLVTIPYFFLRSSSGPKAQLLLHRLNVGLVSVDPLTAARCSHEPINSQPQARMSLRHQDQTPKHRF